MGLSILVALLLWVTTCLILLKTRPVGPSSAYTIEGNAKLYSPFSFFVVFNKISLQIYYSITKRGSKGSCLNGYYNVGLNLDTAWCLSWIYVFLKGNIRTYDDLGGWYAGT